MEQKDLFERLRLLQEQLDNEKQLVNAMSEQLEQAKASFHTTNGRIQECVYLLEQEKIKEQDKAKEEAARLAAEQLALQEGNDGKVVEQDPKQAA
jgi:DNA gyrase/topoisomerase IV subunit A